MLGSYNIQQPGPFRLPTANEMCKWIDKWRLIKLGMRVAVYSRVKTRKWASRTPKAGALADEGLDEDISCPVEAGRGGVLHFETVAPADGRRIFFLLPHDEGGP